MVGASGESNAEQDLFKLTRGDAGAIFDVRRKLREGQFGPEMRGPARKDLTEMIQVDIIEAVQARFDNFDHLGPEAIHVIDGLQLDSEDEEPLEQLPLPPRILIWRSNEKEKDGAS